MYNQLITDFSPIPVHDQPLTAVTAFVKRSWIFGALAAGLTAAGVEWFVRDVEFRGRSYSPPVRTVTASERAEMMARIEAVNSSADRAAAEFQKRRLERPVKMVRPPPRLDAPGPGYREQRERLK